MLVLLTLLTAAYGVVVVRVLRARSRGGDAGRSLAAPVLPVDDRPPTTAVGWPPAAGEAFTSYVEEGIAALDAYLSEGYAT